MQDSFWKMEHSKGLTREGSGNDSNSGTSRLGSRWMVEKVKSYLNDALSLCLFLRLASIPGLCRSTWWVLEFLENHCFSEGVNMLPPPGDNMHLHTGDLRTMPQPVVG